MSHSIQEIAAQLHAEGYRITPQRQLILDAVCALGGHVKPEAVYEQVQKITPTLNRSTVYRTLEFLCTKHILHRAYLPDDQIGYELASPQPHHHLVCHTCQATTELPHAIVLPLFQQIRQEFDFTVETAHLTLWGECGHCRGVKRGDGG